VNLSQNCPTPPARRRWLTWPIGHRYWTLFVCLTTTALLAIPASKVRSDNSAKIFELENDPDRAFFNEYKRQFGANEFIVVTMTCEDLFTHENLRVLQHLTGWLEELPHVDDVTSLADVEDIKGSDEDFIVEPFLDDVPNDPGELRDLRKRALDKPLYVGGVISADGNTAGIIVDVAPAGLSDKERATLVTSIEQYVRSMARTHRRFAVVGRPVVDYYLGAYLNRDMARLMPVAIVLMASILVGLFRHLLGVLLPIVVMGGAVVGGMAFLFLVGGTNNTVTSILPPLLMATGVGISIHLLTHYHELLLSGALAGSEQPTEPSPSATSELMQHWQGRLTGDSPETDSTQAEVDRWLVRLGKISHQAANNQRILVRMVTDLWRPCLVAALTTMAGFGSLAISDVPPIRHFGVAAACGVGYTVILAFTLLPASLAVLRRPVSGRKVRPLQRDPMEAVLVKIGNVVNRRPRTIIAVVTLLSAAAVVQTLRIHVETSGLDFFYEDAPIVVNTHVVERALSGTEDLRISLRSDQTDLMITAPALALQQDLAAWLNDQPEIDKVIALPQYLKDMNRAFHGDDPAYARLPESDDLTAQYMLLYDGQDIRDVVSDDRAWSAITARVRAHGVEEVRRLLDRTQKHLDQVTPTGIEARLTGNTVLTNNIVRAIMSAQIESLALAGLIIFLVVALLFRSLGEGLLSMPPNMFPILLNLGVMGWLAIPLNPATAMISAVAIGIAVDDTVHFLSGYREAQAGGMPPSTAITHVLLTRGRAILTTSLVLFATFAVLAVSSFIPVVQFGLLTAMVMVNAVLADLFFLPAVLLLTSQRRQARSARPT
jgi:predicted RND superfamily exporter protein